MNPRLREWLQPGRVDALLLAAGVAIRLRQYLANFSLEISEAQLARNLIERPVSGLLQPLGLDQAAPVGFLVIERLSIESFGSTEMVLRAFPMFCGIASLFLFRALARRVLSPFGTHVALGLFVVGEYLILHANQVKQYSSDVTITLLLLLAGRWAIVRKYDTASVATLAGVGAVAIWLSHPAVFVLAGIGAIWAVQVLRDRSPGAFLRLAACGGLWAASFGLLYWVSLRHLISNEFLTSYWSKSFMPLPPRSISDLGWFEQAFYDTFSDPGGFRAPALAGAFAVVGLLTLARRNGTLLALLVAPIVLALLASGLGRFPFGGRVILFLMPSLLIFLGAGADRLRELTWHAAPAITIVFVAVVGFGPFSKEALRFLKARPESDARGVVAYLGANVQPGDTIFLYNEAQSLFHYYAPRFGLADRPFFAGTSAESNWHDDVADLDRLMGRPRVWLVFTHVHNRDRFPTEEDFFVFDLERRGRQLDAFKSVQAAVYLYDLSVPPPGAAEGPGT